MIGAIFGFFILAPAFIRGFFPFYQAVNAVEMLPLMDFYNMIFFTVIITGLLFTIPAFFVLLIKFCIIKTKPFTKQRKYIYAGLIIAALLISPGATPQGDLYIFSILVGLIEGSFFIGKMFERKVPVGTPESQSLLSKWFSPVKNCKYCHADLADNSPYCSSCKRFVQ